MYATNCVYIHLYVCLSVCVCACMCAYTYAYVQCAWCDNVYTHFGCVLVQCSPHKACLPTSTFRETLFIPTTIPSHISMVITTTPVVNFNNFTQTLHSIPYSDWTTIPYSIGPIVVAKSVCVYVLVCAPLLICGLALTFLRPGWGALGALGKPVGG